MATKTIRTLPRPLTAQWWRWRPRPADLGEWLKCRRSYLGSSESPALLGLSAWATPYSLWADKRGRVPLDPTPPNTRAELGQWLEPVVARYWAEKTGATLYREPYMLRHPDYPFLGADLDFVAHDANGWAVVEVKTADKSQAGRWRDDVPDAYYVQVQHQLLVTGLDRAWLVVLIGGNDPRWVEIPADPSFHSDLVDLVAAFWDLVESGQAPAVDATETTRATLLREAEDRQLAGVMTLDGDLAALWDEYQQATDQQKYWEVRREAVLNRWLQALVDKQASAGLLPNGHRVSLQRGTTTRVDVDRLRAEWPEVAAQVIETKPRRPSVRVY